MSKERLEELINRKPNRWGNLTIYGFEKDIKILQEQTKGIQELVHQNKRYQKAIKECVERMNAGGAGTRSFVYKKLIEALEGEKWT